MVFKNWITCSVLAGNRVAQAMVSNLELSNVVDSIANSLRLKIPLVLMKIYPI
jgi:hypothetical protein